MAQTILVTGGAGYIGSHTSFLLAEHGYNVIIIDKLLHGQRFDHGWAKLIVGDFGDEKLLHEIFSKHSIDAVMHFAALIEVGHSVVRPAEFYDNNVVKTIRLLDCMRHYNIKHFVFSSSCALYGNPINVPISEDHPKNPISPYGKNKLAVEYILEDYARAYGLTYASLRYFNAAGACAERGLGEQHVPETHIIPLLLRAIRQRKPFKLFGDDYRTPDGTCIRDYIHVLDIAQAHLFALEYIQKIDQSDCFNLGTGYGYSVKEIVDAAEHICGARVIREIVPRRQGDVDILIADKQKATQCLRWEPHCSDLSSILTSALVWEEYNDSFLAMSGNSVHDSKQ